MRSKILTLCYASGILAALLFALGLVVLAGFLPPPAPLLSPQEVTVFYQQHPVRTLMGTFFIMTAMGLLAPWGAAIAGKLRPVEKGVPVLTYIQLVNVAVSTMVVVLCPMFWAAAAYRPFDTSPEIIRVMNDIGWFLVLAPWPPFTFWLLAVAVGIFKDQRPQPAFPRWLGYLSVWSAILFVPAGAVLIFKDGPFAWDGIIAFYIPVICYFLWMVFMSIHALKNPD